MARRPDAAAGGGRSLAVGDALCSAWGLDPLADGKMMWAHLEPRPALAG